MRPAALILSLSILAGSAVAAQRVEGRVWDVTAAEREPLANVRILLLAREPRSLLGLTRTDAEGRFAFEGESIGEVRLEFERNGFVPTGGDDYRNADCQTECGPFELEMIRAGVIHGILTDDLGEPVIASRVFLFCEGVERPQASAVTDDRGIYRLSGLRPGSACRVDAMQGSRRSAGAELEASPVEVEIEAGMNRSIPIVMRRAASVSLRVTGTVQGVQLGEGGRAMLFASSGFGRGRRGGIRRLELKQDGVFEIDDLRPGEYSFRLQIVGGPRRGENVFLGRSEIRANLEGLVLSPQAPWRFSGRVEFDSPAPDERIVIFLRGDDPRTGAVLQARAPEFAFDMQRPDAAPGSYHADLRSEDWFIREVEANGKTYPPEAVELDEAAAATLVFRLSSEFASIQGRVKADASGAPAAHYRVALRAPDGADARLFRSVQTDQQGRFRFDDVRPGRYRIAAWDGVGEPEARTSRLWEEAGPAVRAFPVEAGAEIEIELTAAPTQVGR